MFPRVCLIALGIFILVAASSASNEKYHLHFGTIRCAETEDADIDEILIDRYADGNRETPPLTWDGVVNDAIHHFKTHSGFNNTYKMVVTERDWAIDDSIGEVTIDVNNLNDEYVRMNPWGRGLYHLTWTNLTPHRNVLEFNHHKMTSNMPEQSIMVGYENSIDDDVARKGHRAVFNHLVQGDRMQKVHKKAVKVLHTFKTTSNIRTRNAVVEELRKEVDLNPLRGIIKGIHDGNWPTIVIYGVSAPVDFGFFSFDMAYGIALDVNSLKTAVFLSFGADIGLTAGDEGKIGIGLNRNDLAGVAGFTYSLTIPSYDGLTGGITLSYDAVIDAPNLQEVTYTYGLLPAGASVSFEYAAVLYKT